MPSLLPFVPSRNNYRIGIALNGARYLIDNIHWNGRDGDGAWYFDIREEDETLILAGFKVVIGTDLSRRSTNAFFSRFRIDVLDTSGSNIDAGYDELGVRIQVMVTSSTDVLTTPL